MSEDAVEQPGLPLEQALSVPWKGIRPDVVVYPGPYDDDGHRTWVVEDPVRGATFRLGPTEGMLFAALGRYTNLAQALKYFFELSSVRPAEDELLRFLQMLQRERIALLDADSVAELEKSPETGAAPKQQKLSSRLAHGYIFFRLPLLHPDRFLTRAWPWVEMLWSPPLKILYLVLGLIGLLLTLPQIELYLATTSYLLTPSGAALFAVTLVLLKIGHEFSHAFAAKSLGLHVRTIGIAFIVFWPILYTDTTDAWKLDKYRHRLKIDLAGVSFETVVAGVALFLWAILPEGILRSVMFFLSGASILSSLLVNLNPLMRFDGYYVLMDLWRMDNLQPRAFELVKHKIRRALFDWTGKVPEVHPKSQRMVVYGIAVMLYRVTLAIAIGLAVYYLFFKALGIVVFVIEMWMFLLRPVWMELSFVYRHRDKVGRPWRLGLSFGILVFLVGLVATPIQRVDTFPGLLVWDDVNTVVTASAGVLTKALPEEGVSVRSGDLLVSLDQPELAFKSQNIEYELRMLEGKLETLSSSGEQGGYRNWLLVEMERQRAKIRTLQQQESELQIQAPVSGVVVAVNEDVVVGDMLEANSPLMVLADPEVVRLRAYIHEQELPRIPDDPNLNVECYVADLETPVLNGSLIERGSFPVAKLPNELLLDQYGGDILAQPGAEEPVPRDAHYALEFRLASVPKYLRHGTPCTVWMNTSKQSLLSVMVDGVGRILAEEGFL